MKERQKETKSKKERNKQTNKEKQRERKKQTNKLIKKKKKEKMIKITPWIDRCEAKTGFHQNKTRGENGKRDRKKQRARKKETNKQKKKQRKGEDKNHTLDGQSEAVCLFVAWLLNVPATG